MIAPPSRLHMHKHIHHGARIFNLPIIRHTGGQKKAILIPEEYSGIPLFGGHSKIKTLEEVLSKGSLIRHIPAEYLYQDELAMARRTFSGFSEGSGVGKSDVERLLLAQHHGAPTRLLDWTSSALVACYFASEDLSDDKNTDFKIIAAHVCPFGPANTHFTLRDLRNIDFYDGYIEPDPFDFQDKCSRKALKDVLDIHGSLFVQGSHVSPRVAAQHGYVSIHRDLKSPIDQQCSSALSKLWHITVAAKSRMDFQEGIFQLGIRKNTIFPEIDSLFGAYAREAKIHDRLCSKCDYEG